MLGVNFARGDGAAVSRLERFGLPATGQRDLATDHHDARIPVMRVVGVHRARLSEVAKTADHLTVFQRTPQWAAPLHNGRIRKDEMSRIRANYPEIFARCQETYGCFIHSTDPRSALEVTQGEREAFWEKLYGDSGFGIWMGNFRDILVDRQANALISDFVARKIRQRVKDPAVAEKLIPKNHGFGTRRVPLESGYY